MNTHELAWAAGFFDGEGHVGTPKARPHIHFSISQVDRRVLDRFRRAVGGLGSVHGPYNHPIMKARGNEQPRFYFQVSRYEYVQAIIAMLWPWLDVVKRKQAAAVLRRHREIPIGLRLASRWTACRRGHARTPENVKIVQYKGYECRRCIPCDRERGVRFQREKALALAMLTA
jgi:hypothetical protein